MRYLALIAVFTASVVFGYFTLEMPRYFEIGRAHV